VIVSHSLPLREFSPIKRERMTYVDPHKRKRPGQKRGPKPVKVKGHPRPKRK